MKVTDQRIKQIIKEEVQRALRVDEGFTADLAAAAKKKYATYKAKKAKKKEAGPGPWEPGGAERKKLPAWIRGSLGRAEEPSMLRRAIRGELPGQSAESPEKKKKAAMKKAALKGKGESGQSRKIRKKRQFAKGVKRLKRIYPAATGKGLYDAFYSDLDKAGLTRHLGRYGKDMLWGSSHRRALRKLKSSGKWVGRQGRPAEKMDTKLGPGEGSAEQQGVDVHGKKTPASMAFHGKRQLQSDYEEEQRKKRAAGSTPEQRAEWIAPGGGVSSQDKDRIKRGRKPRNPKIKGRYVGKNWIPNDPALAALKL